MFIKNPCSWASLVAQWWGKPLPVQETRVWSLVREDPVCVGAAQPLQHGYWACGPEPGSCHDGARCLEPALCKKRGHTVTSPSLATGGQLEKNPHDNEDLAQPETRKNINKEKNLFFCLFLLYYHQFSGKRRKQKNTKNQLNWNPELPDEPVSIWLETIGMKQ